MFPEEKNTQVGKLRSKGASLLRQLTGAVVGGSLALGIYYAYEIGSPVITAWLTVPQDQYSIEGGILAQKDLKGEETDRIARRARNIVDTHGQEVVIPPPEIPLPNNWDIEAIENLESAADEGWGEWEGDWPEPPEVPVDNEGTDNWDSAWDDTWEESIDVPSELSFEENIEDDWEDTWEDSFSDEGPQEIPEPAPYQERREEIASVSNAPSLPSSGVGVWIATFLTLCGTAFLHRKRILGLVQRR